MIARCQAGKFDLNAEMVARGMAWAFRKYSRDYAVLEVIARHRHLGIWRVKGAMPAWVWRHNAWEEAKIEAPPGRPIKGNFKGKHGCIYHTPWSRHWHRVKINPSRGDRWFADEAEAITAGCREPRS
jgi:hypothetical protein